jgi:hypothetical protein
MASLRISTEATARMTRAAKESGAITAIRGAR